MIVKVVKIFAQQIQYNTLEIMATHHNSIAIAIVIANIKLLQYIKRKEYSYDYKNFRHRMFKMQKIRGKH